MPNGRRSRSDGRYFKDMATYGVTLFHHLTQLSPLACSTNPRRILIGEGLQPTPPTTG